MSYAYTPGLKVKKSDVILKERMLPISGEVVVKEGVRVDYNDIVARTHIPGEVHLIKASQLTGLMPEEIPKVMLKKVGEGVKTDEIIALKKSFFGIFKTELRAELDGTIEFISDVTGTVAIRKSPTPLDLNAYIPGKILKTYPNRGVIVETKGAIIQGIFGIGGENQGILKMIASPDEVVTEKHVDKDCSGKIIVGGSSIQFEALKKAIDEGVKGIVCGGIVRDDLTRFLGYEIGVAITGNEDIPLTCIILEGFGKMTMSDHTYNILQSLEGNLASINGATQIRAGVIRPEIIIPHENVASIDEKEDLVEGMYPGTLVRIIRAPHFGAIGQIVSLPVNLARINTESSVRVLTVKLGNEEIITVPRANVEIMEE